VSELLLSSPLFLRFFRRSALLSLGWAGALAAIPSVLPGTGDGVTPGTIRVSVVQMRSERDVAANVAKIRARLAEGARQGVRIVAFPECAVSTYYADFAKTLDGETLEQAASEIAAACRDFAINAIVGTATKADGRFLNTALFINSRGEIVARHHKVHLVDGDRDWGCHSGSRVAPVVWLDGVPCSVFICHDSRYPELTRLPVLAGARLMFYISHEAAPFKETKMAPYRAQIMARAVENSVFIAHANAPADDWRTGSHGQSRLVAPDGNIIQEASIASEDVLIADLTLADADAENARRSVEIEPLASWWLEAVNTVDLIR
jgi:predicted amidohydrolase